MVEKPRLHLQKLCVGVDKIADLEDWITFRMEERRKAGIPVDPVHTTRMTPKRTDELLAGGSLYWIIKGAIQCRQAITGFRPVVGEDGISRCQIVLSPELVPTQPRPRRPFQGWRYLKPEDAPPDLSASGGDIAEMPDAMRRELADLGLL
ncbi:MAG: DUF1489 domain-containing protein [Rhodobiaceae bacterium]|nr:DUF1489 domain-containing protein [Rhodobiaceae bacterium]